MLRFAGRSDIYEGWIAELRRVYGRPKGLGISEQRQDVASYSVAISDFDNTLDKDGSLAPPNKSYSRVDDTSIATGQ